MAILNPDGNFASETKIQFQIEDIAIANEGTLRITLFRERFIQEVSVAGGGLKIISEDDTALGNPKKRGQPGTATLILRKTIIQKLPTVGTKLERYFAEPSVDGFDLSVYDTPYLSDILSKSFTGSYTQYNPVLPANTNFYDRLFTKYIYPSDQVTLYCKIEFRQWDADSWDDCEVTMGVLKAAIEADDLFLRHAYPSQTLNYEKLDSRGHVEGYNTETDTERIWNLKFVPVTLAGLGATPVKPTTDPNDTSSWYMPLFMRGGTTYPYDTDINGNLINQGVDFLSYKDVAHNNYFARFRRHINGRLVFQNLLDYTYGAGEYIFEADDIPFTLTCSKLKDNFTSLDTEVTVSVPAHNFASKIAEQYILLPQTVFGITDNLNAGTGTPIPIAQSTYDKKYKNAFQMVTEIAYSFGLIPILDRVWSDTLQKAVPRLRLKQREAVNNEFSTLVPISSHVTGFPETEAGLQVVRDKSFLDAVQGSGMNDDWYAKRNGTLSDWQSPSNLVTKPQANPYTVPSVEKKPTVLNVSLLFGSGNGVSKSLAGQPTILPGWYATGYDSAQYDLNNTQVANGRTIYDDFFANNFAAGKASGLGITEDFPCLSPLVTTQRLLFDTKTVGTQNLFYAFAPVTKASFIRTKSDGTTDTVNCTSLRQLLARYYAKHFVRSLKTYKRTYPTINEFADQTKKATNATLPDDADTYGTKSWKNVQLLYKTKIFEDYYYVKSITRDFEACETTVEYALIDEANPTFNTTWLDDDEQRGELNGNPPTQTT